jgi:hypothetical protein
VTDSVRVPLDSAAFLQSRAYWWQEVWLKNRLTPDQQLTFFDWIKSQGGRMPRDIDEPGVVILIGDIEFEHAELATLFVLKWG